MLESAATAAFKIILDIMLFADKSISIRPIPANAPSFISNETLPFKFLINSTSVAPEVVTFALNPSVPVRAFLIPAAPLIAETASKPSPVKSTPICPFNMLYETLPFKFPLKVVPVIFERYIIPVFRL